MDDATGGPLFALNKLPRAEAGDFLSLCYNSDLAAGITLQPIRRYGFDAAILFADILLLPQALGVDLWFETGEGPRMSTTATADELAGLRATADIHETLNPIYETVRILSANCRVKHIDRVCRRAMDRGHLYDRGTRHQRSGARTCAKGEKIVQYLRVF